MSEATITCPNCKKEIKLTESLATPLIESTRKQYEELLTQKDNDILKREKVIQEREKTLESERTKLDKQVATQVENILKQERTRIADEEARKAKLILETDLEQKTSEISNLKEVLEKRDAKLAEAQKEQAELLRKQRELDDDKRELELTIEKRVQKDTNIIREQIQKETEEQMKHKVMEKEQTITSMQRQIEELKRKAEQGSQQLQGEVLELDLESLLGTRFPIDQIEPVPKGEYGGDIVQRVNSASGQQCGSILWESKRTKNWSDGWLAKLRKDQRVAKAEIAIIVSQALPKDIEMFDHVDGVWVTHPRLAMPVAMTLRNALIEIASARQASEGIQTKAEMVYQYLTGSRFRQRVQAIVEAFSSMQDDLEKEKKAITKQWAKRTEQIDRVMQATVGMYGDLQGIAGKTLQEIEGLSLSALEGPDVNDTEIETIE